MKIKSFLILTITLFVIWVLLNSKLTPEVLISGAVVALLAGFVFCQVVQIVSAVYKEGPKIISSMTHELKDWMLSHKYNTIEEFRGKASQKNIKKPILNERTQFMRYFSDAGY